METSYLRGQKDTTFTVLKQWPIIVALATIAIGIIGILTMSLVYGLKGGKYFDDYGVVMDAGSSKTNTIVYKWRSSKHRGTGRVSQEKNCYARGGIAKMDPMHLEPVIDCAKNVTSVIAPKSLPKTPLFLAATAGMRLLELTDPVRVERILEELRRQLPETNLDLQAVEIISGRDEGIYGWITTNYILKTLELPQKLDPWEPSTYGALDMGGASMQIAYAVPKEAINGSSDITDVQLYGQTYNILSQSNLCFGRDEAENRFKSLLLHKRSGTTVNNPCAPKGFREEKKGSELFAPICANHTLDEGIQNIQNKTFTFVGTSDPASCSQSVAQLLDGALCKKLKFKECFRKITDLPDNQKFLAFATYFYTTSFLKIDNTTLENYENTVKSFCLKNLDEVKKMTNSSFGPQYCFNAQYIHEVLVNGFGFTSDTWKNIEFIGEIGGKDVGWTLGYMINATNIIPVKATPRLISTTSLTVSLVLFIIIIVATAVFLLYTYKKNMTSLS